MMRAVIGAPSELRRVATAAPAADLVVAAWKGSGAANGPAGRRRTVVGRWAEWMGRIEGRAYLTYLLFHLYSMFSTPRL